MSLSSPLPRPRSGETIAAAHITALSEAIRDRTPISSPSIRVVPRTGGFALETITKGGGMGGTFRGNWSPSAGDDNTVVVSGGTVYDSGGAHVVAEATLNAPNDTLYYIYLQVNFTATTVDGYVVGGSISSGAININTTGCPVNTNTAAYILLATWNGDGGGLEERYAWFPFSFQFNQKDATPGDVAANFWIS